MSWLVTLSDDTQLAEVEVRVSPAAERIVTALRARFEISHEPNELLPWFLIDFAQAMAALSEYNLRTGGNPGSSSSCSAQCLSHRARDRGTIIGLIQGNTFAVKLDGCTPNVMTARRDELKPIVRSHSPCDHSELSASRVSHSTAATRGPSGTSSAINVSSACRRRFALRSQKRKSAAGSCGSSTRRSSSRSAIAHTALRGSAS
jgi:hypothetical protein